MMTLQHRGAISRYCARFTDIHCVLRVLIRDAIRRVFELLANLRLQSGNSTRINNASKNAVHLPPGNVVAILIEQTAFVVKACAKASIVEHKQNMLEQTMCEFVTDDNSDAAIVVCAKQSEIAANQRDNEATAMMQSSSHKLAESPVRQTSELAR